MSNANDWPDLRDGLRYTPYAYAKMCWMAHRGSTEVGGWGILSKDHHLLVYDFVLVEQECTSATVEFTEEGIQNYCHEMIDRKIDPVYSQRVWIHTHPHCGASPSGTDVQTFQHNMGEPKPDWCIMAILCRSHKISARLQYNVGPCSTIELPSYVDWRFNFSGSDHEAWEKEYTEMVCESYGYSHISHPRGSGYYSQGKYVQPSRQPLGITQRSLLEAEQRFWEEAYDHLDVTNAQSSIWDDKVAEWWKKGDVWYVVDETDLGLISDWAEEKKKEVPEDRGTLAWRRVVEEWADDGHAWAKRDAEPHGFDGDVEDESAVEDAEAAVVEGD